MWDIVSIALLVVLGIVALAAIIAVVVYYLLPRSFRFWFLDLWADFPLIGMAARWSRMSDPSNKEANSRLDSLFNAYHNHIHDPLPKDDYNRARDYLSIAGDSEASPAPFGYRLLLIVLMTAEAFTFSFLLGVSISPDISEELAEIIAVVIAFVLAALFAFFGHPAGHLLRRTQILKSACRKAISADMDLGKGEKSHMALTEMVSLDQPQDKDKPNKHNFDSQRLLNRIRKSPDDQGGYFLPIAFVVAVLVSGWFQYRLRSGSAFLSELLDLPGAQIGQGTSDTANSFFVLIFFLTQGLALYLGYKFGFLGRDSARAYRIVGSRDTHRDYMIEYEARERRADESLASLHKKFRRYPLITAEDLNYRQRSARLRKRLEEAEQPSPPPPSPGASKPRLVQPPQNGTDG